MTSNNGHLLNIFDWRQRVDLPEGIILADSILFILIATLLIYTFLKSKTGDREKRQSQSIESDQNSPIDFETRDILMQPKNKTHHSDIELPFSNFSIRKAIIWLLVLFMLFNVLIYITLIK